MVKLRLKRYGKKRQPSYRIVAIDSRERRQARPLQELGHYNPRTKEITLEAAEVLKWLRQGAQPTETLESILKKAGIYELLKAGTSEAVAPVHIPGIPKPVATATAVVTAPAPVATVEVAEEAVAEAPAEIASADNAEAVEAKAAEVVEAAASPTDEAAEVAEAPPSPSDEATGVAEAAASPTDEAAVESPEA
jgi:small subunit ribosomal protein S16